VEEGHARTDGLAFTRELMASHLSERLRALTVAVLCCAWASGVCSVAAGGAEAAVPAVRGAGMARGPPNGFTVAHIAAPLIRRRLPGQAPFPQARARLCMELLELALEHAGAEGADAIALTGSVISAPPPLRQCDKGGYYKHPDAAAAMEEAQADYMQVKTLLEQTGLPYAVTPGAEDCIEAFERVFGLEPSAPLVRAQAASRLGGEAGWGRGHQQLPQAASESEESSDEPLDVPAALSAQAIREFQARLKAAKPPPPAPPPPPPPPPQTSNPPPEPPLARRLKGGGGDLEDIGGSCCAGGAGSSCGDSSAASTRSACRSQNSEPCIFTI
jgi:hypothetical protein